jgi:hypothetical protein
VSRLSSSLLFFLPYYLLPAPSFLDHGAIVKTLHDTTKPPVKNSTASRFAFSLSRQNENKDTNQHKTRFEGDHLLSENSTNSKGVPQHFSISVEL